MSDRGNQEPVRLMNFREWVPDSARFWLYICFLAVFQFSNGFYFTTMAQVVGERNVTMNDAHMFGQAVLIGLTFYFPLAFRLKFRFTNRTSLTVAATRTGTYQCCVPVRTLLSTVAAIVLCRRFFPPVRHIRVLL